MTTAELTLILIIGSAFGVSIAALTVGTMAMNLMKQEAKEERWIMLEQVILSGQIADRDVHQIMREEPEFGEWLKQRAERRQSRH